MSAFTSWPTCSGSAAEVLDRLARDFETLAPESVAELRDLVTMLGHYGIPADRIEIDLGFGRGIGFYSQMIFELVVRTPDGPVEVCGGGRYDGLARVLGSDRDDRGVGFAFGLERLLAVLDARGSEPAPEEVHPEGAVVVVTAPGLTSSAIALVQSRRENGWRTLLLLETSLARAKAYAREMRLAKVLMVNHELEHPESFEEHRVDESL